MQRLILIRACWIVLTIPFLFQTTLRGQDAAAPNQDAVASNQDAAALIQRMHAADAGSALDTPDLKPWHLKMTVQLFDDKGQPSDQGTVEEWWRAPDVERREYKTSSYSETEIRNGGKTYRSKDTGTPPYDVELLRQQVVHPMPAGSEMDHSTPEFRKLSAGKMSLDCIMLSRPLKQFGPLPLGLFPTYCFDSGKDIQRLSFDFGQQQIVRNRIGLFQGRTVPLELTVALGQTKVAAGQVAALDTATLPDSSFEPTDGIVEGNTNPVRASSGVIQGTALKQVPPIYPLAARLRGSTGVVVLHATIGSDGHIHNLQIISAPDADLAIAAIAAVQQWSYKAYLIGGQPVSVETTINVNFTMSH